MPAPETPLRLLRYASRGGLKPYVLIPEGFVAQGKLAQALMYGAEIISINGNFDKALEIVRELSSEHPIELVNSVNPYRIQGQKTAAFEIIDDLGIAPIGSVFQWEMQVTLLLLVRI